MSTMSFVKAGPGVHEEILAGQTATAVLPIGCVLRVYTAGQWSYATSPYTATQDCAVRVDCDVYGGGPVTATLEIA